MANLFTDGLLSAFEDGTVNAYKPRHMLSDQIQTESGGRQFDKDGSTLVGRHRDGSLPSPQERAYGVSQMQVRTAREVAKRHNIPFRMGKFMSDSDYNLMLGDLHMGDLKAKYGDETLARAAYHSGEGTVDRSLRRYGREGFHQGLGPEGKAYIGRGGQGSGGARVASSPSPGVARAPDISKVQATPAEKAAMAGPGNMVANPFTAVEDIRNATDERRRRAYVGDVVLNQIVEKAQTTQAEQEVALRQTLRARQGITEHMKAITEEAAKRTQPIFKKRQAIADREVELTEMNPVEATIKSIFNPNYNAKYLRGSRQALEGQLSEINAAYADDYNKHQTLAALAAAEYGDQSQLFELQRAGFSQDIQNSVLAYESAGRIESSELGALANNSAVIQAQYHARENLKISLTDGQLNEGIALADSNPTKEATINGIQMPAQMLIEERSRRQNVAIDMEARQLAIQGQRMNLVEATEQRLIDNFDRGTLEAGIANNGVIQGQQFDVVKLAARLQGVKEAQQLGVQTEMQKGAGSVAGLMLHTLTDNHNAMSQRQISMFGKLPVAYGEHSTQMTLEMRQIAAGFQKAQEAGNVEDYALAVLPQIQAIAQRERAVIEASVNQWAGGNEDVKALGMSWITGQPIGAQNSIKGLIQFARYGLPAGLNFTGTSAKVFQAVKEEVNAKSSTLDKEAGTQAEREARLVERIQQRIVGIYNGSSLNETIRMMPTTAKGIKVDGRPHPFSRLNQNEWISALDLADTEGYARTAQQLNKSMTPETFKRMLKVGTRDPAWTQVVQGLPVEQRDITFWKKQLTENQNQALLGELDRLSEGTGVSFSAAYKDLMIDHDGQLAEAVSRQNSYGSNSSFGSFVTSQAASGGSHTALQNYATGIVSDWNSRRRDTISIRRQREKSLAYNPIRRAEFILGSVNGLSAADEQVLLSHLKTLATPTEWVLTQRPEGMGNLRTVGSSATGLDKAVNARIDSWILTGKAEDPNLERIRRHAAKTWGTLAGPMTQAMTRDAERQ